MIEIFPWKKIAKLPAPSGYKENIGLANTFYGVIDNKIIIGGGSNFPTHPLENGTRITHNDIFLLRDCDESFKIIDKTTLDYNLTDGKAVVFNNILFFIGDNKIIKINIINNKLHIEKYYELDFTINNHIAEVYEGTIYYGLGQINGNLSNKMFSFNIFTKENKEIADFPSSSRAQSTSNIFEDNILIFGGGSSTAYTDSYKYNITKNIWHKVTDVAINNNYISLIGARSVKINKEECLIVGGFNKEIWDEANDKLSTLQGEEKQQFRKFYFTQDYPYYKWNKQLLIYNYKTDSFRTIGEIPFYAPCGHALINNDDNIYVLMGEIRPSERTPNMYKIEAKYLKK